LAVKFVEENGIDLITSGLDSVTEEEVLKSLIGTLVNLAMHEEAILMAKESIEAADLLNTLVEFMGHKEQNISFYASWAISNLMGNGNSSLTVPATYPSLSWTSKIIRFNGWR